MAKLTPTLAAQPPESKPTPNQTKASRASTARRATTDPYGFQMAHRRLAWLLRISFGTNIILLCGFVITVSVIPVLLPLRTTEIALLRSDPADDRVYRVEPISQEVDGFDLLLEQMSRRYVKLLLEIDGVSQTSRMREAFAMTDNGFYQKFRKRHIDSGIIQDAIDDGLNRTVLVESADRISESNGTFQYAVDFVQIDKRNGETFDQKKLRAYLSITTRPHEVRSSEKFENPFGIRILNLILKPRSNS